MTQEEKSKAYDEKLDIARHIYADPSVKEEDKYYIEVIFPELAESEDERIRKALIENFKFFGGEHLKTSKWGKDDDLLVTDILAWLERQGEKETLCDKCKKAQPSHSCQDITALGRCALEKQGEQKPAWKPSDEYIGMQNEIARLRAKLRDFGCEL